MNRLSVILVAVSIPLVTSCASAPVDMNEPRRVVGTESSVRIDAEINDEYRPGSALPITYQITNQRDADIAVADVMPDSSWDPETRTLTVHIGSEVPGEVMLPRLVRIRSGETKTFSAAARVAMLVPSRPASPNAASPTLLRLKVNFLRDTAPFAELIDIPQKAIANAKRADELFPLWLEQNEVIFTNAVPVRVTGSGAPALTDPAGDRGSFRRRIRG